MFEGEQQATAEGAGYLLSALLPLLHVLWEYCMPVL